MCARYAYKIKAKQTASNRTTFSVFAIGKFHCWRPVMWSSCILFYVCLAIFFFSSPQIREKNYVFYFAVCCLRFIFYMSLVLFYFLFANIEETFSLWPDNFYFYVFSLLLLRIVSSRNFGEFINFSKWINEFRKRLGTIPLKHRYSHLNLEVCKV